MGQFYERMFKQVIANISACLSDEEKAAIHTEWPSGLMINYFIVDWMEADAKSKGDDVAHSDPHC